MFYNFMELCLVVLNCVAYLYCNTTQCWVMKLANMPSCLEGKELGTN